MREPADHIRARVRLTNLKKKGAVNLSLDAQAKDDNVSTTLDWGNNAAATYSGKLAAVAKFLRTSGEKSLLKAMVDVKPTDVILMILSGRYILRRWWSIPDEWM